MPSQQPDHYAVLGVARDASDADIKLAYRRAIRAHHPDMGGDPAMAARLSEAFEMLSQRRATYDADLRAAEPAPQPSTSTPRPGASHYSPGSQPRTSPGPATAPHPTSPGMSVPREASPAGPVVDPDAPVNSRRPATWAWRLAGLASIPAIVASAATLTPSSAAVVAVMFVAAVALTFTMPGYASMVWMVGGGIVAAGVALGVFATRNLGVAVVIACVGAAVTLGGNVGWRWYRQRWANRTIPWKSLRAGHVFGNLGATSAMQRLDAILTARAAGAYRVIRLPDSPWTHLVTYGTACVRIMPLLTGAGVYRWEQGVLWYLTPDGAVPLVAGVPNQPCLVVLLGAAPGADVIVDGDGPAITTDVNIIWDWLRETSTFDGLCHTSVVQAACDS